MGVRRLPGWGDLLENIVRQDYAGVCEHFCRRGLQTEKVPLWFFHRWDKEKNGFSLVYPTPSNNGVGLSSSARDSLEDTGCLVDANDPQRYGQGEETQKYPCTVLLPLFYNSELVGVLQGFTAGAGEKCSKLDAELQAHLRLMAQSLHLIALLEEKEKLAFTDSLTGLFNYQFLRQFLHSELARCSRYEKRVSVLFLDVDWFKMVNDAHGHLIGSHVLKELGDLLRLRVRGADVVARYGGDEYVVVLTEVGVDGACRSAERLREGIGRYVFGKQKGCWIRLTTSIGVAAFPDHGSTADELIRRSDMAMYKAKADNKNCVKVALVEEPKL